MSTKYMGLRRCVTNIWGNVEIYMWYLWIRRKHIMGLTGTLRGQYLQVYQLSGKLLRGVEGFYKQS